VIRGGLGNLGLYEVEDTIKAIDTNRKVNETV
jgi:hypothetical protein